jgi:hypothetical protein
MDNSGRIARLEGDTEPYFALEITEIRDLPLDPPPKGRLYTPQHEELGSFNKG